MHIALLTDGITPYVTGGMQRHSHHLARHLLKLGVELTLVHSVSEEQPLPSEEEVINLLEAKPGRLHVHGFQFPKKTKLPGHYLRESYRYSCMIYEELKPHWSTFDFIYAKGFSPWCLLEKKKKGVHMGPVGIKFHGYEMFQTTKSVKVKLEQQMLKPPVVFINRNADLIFSYGGMITDLIASTGVDRRNIVEIGSGIDDSWLLPSPAPSDEMRKMLFIGRNEKRKGIDDLMAMKDLLTSSPIEFHWVGPLPKNKRIDAPNMIYHGEIKDPEQLKSIIDGCDILITPSHSEGMPNVILEAMARGLAVVATRVGAVPIMVSDTNGRLIDPNDRKALRQALLEMIRIPESTLYEMKVHSLKRIREKFLWTAVASQTLDAIKKFTFTS